MFFKKVMVEAKRQALKAENEEIYNKILAKSFQNILNSLK